MAVTVVAVSLEKARINSVECFGEDFGKKKRKQT
jgi:hypothetical protein